MALFPPNLILYVPEGSSTLDYDKYGNPIELSAGGLAGYLLSVTEDSPELRANAGLDTATATYTGRCVGKLKDLKIINLLNNQNIDTRQKFLPATVIANVRLKCLLIEPDHAERSKNPSTTSPIIKRPGTFVVLSVFQSRYPVVTKVLGTRIQGYFEFGR